MRGVLLTGIVGDEGGTIDIRGVLLTGRGGTE